MSSNTWMWGQGNYGQLSDNATADYSSPIQITGDHQFIDLAEGQYHSLALKVDGSVWCCGLNINGQLGDNSQMNRSSPVLVVGAHSFIAVAAGALTSYGLKVNGQIWAWGGNGGGELGNGGTTPKSSPVIVVVHSFVKIASGINNEYSHILALQANGQCYAWGYNPYGEVGDNTSANLRGSPVPVAGSHSFTEIVGGGNHSLALKSNGEVWSWGGNFYGQLGNNGTYYNNESSPVLVVGAHSFVKVAAGLYHSLALKVDGSVFSWGYNANGELGINDTTTCSSPMQVVGNHSFIDIKAGGYHSLALKANGECWSWGYNGSGELGDESAINCSSPVLVVGADFTRIACGFRTSGGF